MTTSTPFVPAGSFDQSHLDRKYFIDNRVFNCPFCNRRNVAYTVAGKWQFDWTNSKTCWAFLCECSSCDKTSMHLSYHDIELQHLTSGPPRFSLTHRVDIDSLFFYSVPTSFFTVDERVPRMLRELLTEAEGSLRGNFLTGASGCVRKMIYELGVEQGASGGSYDDRLKSLKAKRPDVDADFFDTLLSIQEVTSSKVHENAYDGWEAKHLRLIIATIREILYAIYVAPEERKDRRQRILNLKAALTPPATLLPAAPKQQA